MIVESIADSVLMPGESVDLAITFTPTEFTVEEDLLTIILSRVASRKRYI